MTRQNTESSRVTRREFLAVSAASVIVASAGKLPALVRYGVESLDDRGRPSRIRTPDGAALECDAQSISEHFSVAHGLDVELMHAGRDWR